MRNREIFIRNSEQEKHPGYVGEFEKQWDTPERMFGIVSELMEDNPSSNWNVLTELHEETLRLIERVQSPAMVADIYRLGQKSTEACPQFSRFDLDINEKTSPIYPGTPEQAAMSVECALNGADMLMNDSDTKIAISVSRPPGHHAGRDFLSWFLLSKLSRNSSERVCRKWTRGIYN